jgi:hypothetical protein
MLVTERVIQQGDLASSEGIPRDWWFKWEVNIQEDLYKDSLRWEMILNKAWTIRNTE